MRRSGVNLLLFNTTHIILQSVEKSLDDINNVPAAAADVLLEAPRTPKFEDSSSSDRDSDAEKFVHK